jgi:RNA-directed DNA polymerase
MASSVSFELNRDPDESKRLFYSLRSASDVADLLEVPYWHLVYVLYRSPDHYPYRTFTIPKKSGGVREISAPASSVRILQSKLNSVLRLVYRPKPCVHGFVTERSIVSNAVRHTGKRFVLNIDLEDFFPSVNFGRVRGMFMAKPYGLGERAATVLARICCYENQLPQGAPTSPTVSNMVCARLDGELQRLARDHSCMYTRYADDLTFSTTLRGFPTALAAAEGGWTGAHLRPGEELLSVIKSNGFRVNASKQRLQYRSCHQEVTGITVNRFPNVDRRFVRQIRAMLHAWDRYGLEAAEREFGERYDRRSRRPGGRPPSFGRIVRGKLDFLKMVVGESASTYRTLAGKLHDLDPSLIGELPKEAPALSEGGASGDKTWDYRYEQLRPLVFQLELRKRDGVVGGGTAFAWGPRALATAAHNLDGEVHVSPPLPEGMPARDFIRHPGEASGVDAALIRLSGVTLSGRSRPQVRREPARPGEEIAILGYASIPQRQPALSISTGRVESVTTDYSGTVHTIQVTANVRGGMSGGPVIDRGGQLVGMAIEQSFDDASEDVPRGIFYHVLPVRYLLDIELEQGDSVD